MNARAPKLAPLLWTALAVVFALVFLALNGMLVRSLVSSSFDAQQRLRSVRTTVARVLQHQLDEETGLRGFAATRDPQFLQPLESGRRFLPDEFVRVRASLSAEGLATAVAAVNDAAAMNAEWSTTVAKPLLAHNGRDVSGMQLRGKALMDRFRHDIDAVERELTVRETSVDADARAAVDRIGLFVLAAVLLTSIAALLFVRQRTAFAKGLEARRVEAEAERRRAAALEAAYMAEKRIADTLQDAIAQRPLPIVPRLQFSATYVPALDEAKVGGDWYDVIELPGDRVLFAIGDVAGHGLDAAVTMSRARQALIASALLDSNPASVLERVNAELLRQGAPMVTAVTGFADARTFEFVYASAGHPPPMLIERKRPPRLLSFGDVPLGIVADATFQTQRVQSMPGAMLVLYTDGAIEHSKDVIDGEALLLEAAARATLTEGHDVASRIHEGVFGGSPAGDDVAILTVGFTTDSPQTLTISVDNAQSAFSGRVARVATAGEAVVSLATQRARRIGAAPRLRKNAS